MIVSKAEIRSRVRIALEDTALEDTDGLTAEVIEALSDSGNVKRIGEPCARCGETGSVVCCYAELGGPHEYRDNWVHCCVACLDVIRCENVTTMGSETKEDQLCGFCGRDLLEISETVQVPKVRQRPK